METTVNWTLGTNEVLKTLAKLWKDDLSIIFVGTCSPEMVVKILGSGTISKTTDQAALKYRALTIKSATLGDTVSRNEIKDLSS